MIATGRLYLTGDRLRVVQEGSADAAFLLAIEGAEIPAKFVPMIQAIHLPPVVSEERLAAPHSKKKKNEHLGSNV